MQASNSTNNNVKSVKKPVAARMPKKKRIIKREFMKNPKSGKGKFGDMKDPEFKKAIEKVQGWSKDFTDPDEIPDSAVPDEYDFRNINGYDFTGKLRD